MTLIAFEFYLQRTLKGDINNHILSGEMFGVPEALQQKGVKTLYSGPGQTGWDGQFYYYIANDLLGLEDTPEHIDAPSYRYQRVGLSLYTAILATLTGQDWVSPRTFFTSYFLLVLAATWCGALLFSRLSVDPALILLWSLSTGVYLTLFNALPDAAADAFLILGLSALFAGQFALAAMLLIFSALSREIYVLFPLLIGAVYFVDQVLAARKEARRWTETAISLLRWQSYYWLALPVVTLVAWQIYVTNHFGVAPSSQAHGILGPPFVAWFNYFSGGLLGTHKRFESVLLLLFLAVMVTACVLAWRVLFTRFSETTNLMRGIAAATLVLLGFYACFGPTVAMHYTGYMKAAAVFGILIPLLMSAAGVTERFERRVVIFLIVAVLVSGFHNWGKRILRNPVNFEAYTRMAYIKETKNQSCLGAYDAKVTIHDVSIHNRAGILPAIFGSGDYIVIRVGLQNTGQVPLISTKGSGSVHMGYEWFDADGKVTWRSDRSAIVEPLLPGETSELSVVSLMPKAKGAYTLRLSPVQEGCVWFHAANTAASTDLKFHIE
ncbi:MAG TPA: hypothetical protein VKA94_15065 [Hyphomicrobiales bacterium]|nr:hypothetical protein [Hyphomicrobiales bacterium]